jgi:uncharacterized membrane protein YqjE
MGFDAMANTAFRVILLRSAEERPLFQFFTVTFVALLVLAAGFTIWEMVRSGRMEALEADAEEDEP